MRVIAFILIVLMFPLSSLADCDFSTIEKLPDGRFAYSSSCHRQVGLLVQNNKDMTLENESLRKAITLKDLQIGVLEKRVDIWITTSQKLEDRVDSIDRWKSTNQVLYFTLGIVFTSAAVYGASKLR